MSNSIYRITGTAEDIANLYLQGRDATAPFPERVTTDHWSRTKDNGAPQYVTPKSTVCHPERTVPKLVYDPGKLKFLETVHESASNAVFKVKWEGELRALKVNHLLLADMQNDHDLRENKKSSIKMPPRTLHLPDRFANELKAYNRLLQTDICEDGFVPRPYGWFIFTGFDDPYWETPQDGILPASPYDEWLKDFKEEMRSPRAMLLEWIDAPRLKTPKITSDQFRSLFKIFEKLHRARIMHCDVSPRNFFVRGSTVVITDFDVAEISEPDSNVDMVATTMEVRGALWKLFLKEEYM